MKFSIGDCVMSKKTGYPGIGHIVGVQHPILWTIQNGHINYWYSLYPDYMDKFIYVVMFDKKVPVCTKEEFGGKDISDLEYNAKVSYSMFIAYPEDDLEKYEN